MAATRDSVGDTFPAFLDTDPFPSRANGRPISMASIATDATSEFGDDFASAKERHSDIPAMTGPVGEAGLPPSRPTSAAGTNGSQRAGTPRSGNNRSVRGRGREGDNYKNSIGGESDSIPTSPTNTTHVPSIAAQGFLRPMSSQKLQAERSERPQNTLPQVAEGRRMNNEDEETRRQRYSIASLSTLRERAAQYPRRDEEIPPMPGSRGTTTTVTNDGSGYPEYQGAGSVISSGSEAILHSRRSRPESHGTHLNTPQMPTSKTSSKSLRTSFGFNSRKRSQLTIDKRPSPGLHSQLHSDPSSPNDDEKSSIPTGTRPSKSNNGKNYEYFAGNMLFFVEGRCLNTKARPLNLVTLTLTVLPAALFFGFSAPWLWHNVSPAIPIIFAYVFFVALSSFFHAAFSDPGILPRNIHPHPPNPEEDDPLAVGPPTTEWVMVKTFASQGSKDNEAQQGGDTAMEVPTKYCKSCNIWRPPRAHHCRICDACMETQDHHCVWLNNCVGRRNYRYFFSYVGFASLLALLLIAFSLTHVILYGQRHGISFGESLSGRTQERMAFAMFLYAILALPYPGSLFVYHIFLTSRGETTREYLNSHKFQAKDRHRPFSQRSMLKNISSVIMRPRPPTYLQFKSKHQTGDLRFGHTETKKQRKQQLKGRYSTQQIGEEKHEMSQLPPQTSKPQARGAGGLNQSNSTPRM